MTPHMRELSQKFEGVEMVDPPSLSRRVRRGFPDLTSPLTKSASRKLLSEICRKLDLHVPPSFLLLSPALFLPASIFPLSLSLLPCFLPSPLGLPLLPFPFLVIPFMPFLPVVWSPLPCFVYRVNRSQEACSYCRLLWRFLAGAIAELELQVIR